MYDIIAIIGTSDQPCWLAEACKILLLLLLLCTHPHYAAAAPQLNLVTLIDAAVQPNISNHNQNYQTLMINVFLTAVSTFSIIMA